MRRQDARQLMFGLVFVLVVVGSVWSRKVEVRERESARSASVALASHRDALITDQLAVIRRCIDENRCADPTQLGFPPGHAHNSSSADEQYWLALSDSVYPEYHDFTVLTFQWDAAVRAATRPDGSVTSESDLIELLNGPLPGQMTSEFADAGVALDVRLDRGRLLSRLFGWAWKVGVAALVALPLTASILETRRLRRLWRSQQATKPTFKLTH
jgi:hypothetical protein